MEEIKDWKTKDNHVIYIPPPFKLNNFFGYIKKLFTDVYFKEGWIDEKT